MAASPFAVSSTSSTARQVWRFGVLASVFALLWALGSAYGLGRYSAFDAALCHQLADASAWGLRLLGWSASVSIVPDNIVILNGQPSVMVGAQCDGLVLYALLIGFVLAYPGPARRRLWFIPLGMAALWLLNIIRILALALNQRYSPATFDFDHHYAFNAVAYAALGGLWLLWTRQSNSSITAASYSSADNQPVDIAAAQSSWLTARTLLGAALLVVLTLVSIYQTQATIVLSTAWVWLLANGPAGLHRLPGATAGNGDVPDGVSHLALPVGVAYLGLFLVIALLALRLLLPDRGWQLAWRCYAGVGLGAMALFLVGWLGGGPGVYRFGRMLLDFIVSLLPVAGLLVLLWRPIPKAEAAGEDLA